MHVAYLEGLLRAEDGDAMRQQDAVLDFLEVAIPAPAPAGTMADGDGDGDDRPTPTAAALAIMLKWQVRIGAHAILSVTFVSGNT